MKKGRDKKRKYSQTEEFLNGTKYKNRITRSHIIFFDQTQITSSVLCLEAEEQDRSNLVHKQEHNRIFDR